MQRDFPSQIQAALCARMRGVCNGYRGQHIVYAEKSQCFVARATVVNVPLLRIRQAVGGP